MMRENDGMDDDGDEAEVVGDFERDEGEWTSGGREASEGFIGWGGGRGNGGGSGM